MGDVGVENDGWNALEVFYRRLRHRGAGISANDKGGIAIATNQDIDG